MNDNDILVLIEKHRDQLYRFALRTVWDSSMADDVFASTVLAAYENRDKFIPGTNFRAWIFKILVNKCFVANREVRRAPEALTEAVADQMSFERRSGVDEILKDPKDFLEQCGEEVYQAFRKLSTAQRSCILLKDVERFSYQEIAQTLGIPVATVMTHLARGRTVLRKELLDYAQRMGIVRNFPRLVSLNKVSTGDERSAQA